MTTYNLHLRCEDGGNEVLTVEADTLDEASETAVEKASDWVRDGEWGDEGASVGCRWTLADEDGNEVDEGHVTVEIDPNHDALIRNAGGDLDCDHDWTSEGEGGCRENPGVWSTGGTAMVYKLHCRKCGLHRTENCPGSQRNPGEHDTVSYTQPDRWCSDCETEAWPASQDSRHL